MSEESRVETAPQPHGQGLILRRMRIALIRQSCSVLLISVSSLYLLFHGSKTPAVFLCLGTVLSAASLLKFWRQYCLVKSGVIAAVQPQVNAHPVRVHPAASIVAISLMTLMVLITGAGTVYIFPLMSAPLGSKLILVGINAILLLLTGLFWYRIATEGRKMTVVEPFYEQGEGVWPPAPQVPKIE